MKRIDLANATLGYRVRHWIRCAGGISLFVLFAAFQVSAGAFAQKERVTFSTQQLSVEQVFDVITAQLKYDVFYSEDEVNIRKEVQLPYLVMEVEEVLRNVLGKDFTYSLEGHTIVIRPMKQTVSVPEVVKLAGSVKDKDGMPLPGVTVLLKGTTIGTATDQDGKYNMEIPKTGKIVLIYSFIGMETKEVAWKGENTLDVVLEEEAASLDEVVVTGYFQRKSESFTGSASTYRSKELKMVGKQNVLQSLKTLDPAFNIKESLEFGSDPNRMPNMEIRGKTSVVGLEQEYAQDPNQPLFILDGFETSLESVVDLNMERVESITLLKDAASTAIYGSRAANGVVVIETKRPEPGELRVSYTGDFSVTMPDLTVYNLMNASEKLQFEQLAGVYSLREGIVPNPETQWQLDELYNYRKHKVESGVNSYWLSEPVRTGFVHKHNLYLEGGDQSMRYGIGVSYGGTQGVMLESSRDVFSGNVDLIYRKGKISFTNKLTLDYIKTSDPDVDFEQYAKASPYYEKRNTDGSVSYKLESESQSNPAKRNVYNPLWDASLNNLHATHSFGVNENLNMEWSILQSLRLRGRFGVRKSIKMTEDFIAPQHSDFSSTTDINKKGSYNKNDANSWSYEGDVTLTYGGIIAEVHRMNFIGGWTFSDITSEVDGYGVIGFPVDDVQNSSFANQYPENSKSSFTRSQKRAASWFVNTGYAYNERYLVDANIRIDGASAFGSNRRYTTTWSAGVSWNIHNEAFLKGNENVNLLKLRGSIGNPGNLNFGGYNSFTTYVYNTALNNSNGIGTTVETYGNPDLKWQKTLDLNLGLDITLFKNRFKATVEAYRKMTDPLLVETTVASSTGSGKFTTNVGHQRTLGINANASYTVINNAEKDMNWLLSFNIRRQKSELGGIGNSLETLNQKARGESDSSSDTGTDTDTPASSDFAEVSLKRYYDKADPDALWAVRSAGIDPMTGKEVYIKKNGERTFEYDNADEVVIGIGAPKYEGVIGTSFYYKGFSCSVYCRYKFGEYKMNSDLYNKVENITRSTWTNNLDRRALYGRWQKPGDQAEFKGISIMDKVDPMSSRFIQKERVFAGESFSVGYEFSRDTWLKYLGMRSLSVKAYMNDIFRLSNIKMERGTKYPFARTVAFSVTANF